MNKKTKPLLLKVVTFKEETNNEHILSYIYLGALKKLTATHSSILAWETPQTEKRGGLQSLGSQKSRTQLKRLNNIPWRPCRSGSRPSPQ